MPSVVNHDGQPAPAVYFTTAAGRVSAGQRAPQMLAGRKQFTDADILVISFCYKAARVEARQTWEANAMHTLARNGGLWIAVGTGIGAGVGVAFGVGSVGLAVGLALGLLGGYLARR